MTSPTRDDLLVAADLLEEAGSPVCEWLRELTGAEIQQVEAYGDREVAGQRLELSIRLRVLAAGCLGKLDTRKPCAIVTEHEHDKPNRRHILRAVAFGTEKS